MFTPPLRLILVMLLLSGSGHASVLYDLNSTVLDGGTGENTFFVSNSQASPAGLSYNSSTPSLTWTEGANGTYTYLLGYYNSFSLTNVGDSITLSFTITPNSASAFSSSSDASMRIGLLNSGGNKITSNQTGTGSTTFNNYTGYMAYYRPNGTTSSSDTFLQRTSSNVILLSGGTVVSGAPTLVSPGTGVITASFTMSLEAGGVRLTSVINGGTVQSVLDTSGTVTSFDTFGIFGYSGSANPTLTLSNLTISAVPESSTGWLMGLGAACLILRLRRRCGRPSAS